MLTIDFNNEIVKAAPIAGAVGSDVVGRMFFGMTLNEWFYVATILYIIVQIVLKVYQVMKEQTREDKKINVNEEAN